MGLSQYATLVYSSLSHVYLYLSYVKDMVVRVTLMLNSHLAVDLLVALAGKGFTCWTVTVLFNERSVANRTLGIMVI